MESHFRETDMRAKTIIVLSLFLLIAAGAWAYIAQDKAKRPSPPATAEVTLSGKKITIDYGQPSMRGRKIFGALVPFGQVWRTGANEATTLKTPVDLSIGGQRVPAGTYTLFTVPAEESWTLIVNKQTGQWGTNYDEKQDLIRIPMRRDTMPMTVEAFNISFADMGANKILVMEWEYTRAWVEIKVK